MFNLLLIITLLQLKFYAALFLIVLCCHNVIERLRDITKIVNKNNKAEDQNAKHDAYKPTSIGWNLFSIILGLLLLKYMGDYILSVIQAGK